jgi:hypothetical protein
MLLRQPGQRAAKEAKKKRQGLQWKGLQKERGRTYVGEVDQVDQSINQT